MDRTHNAREVTMDTDLSEVINWRRRDARITLSGQPTEAQLGLIAQLGVTRVINLGPHTNDGALKDEPGTVAAQGMEYIYIPVDFEAPTEANFEAFCVAIDAETSDSAACPLHLQRPRFRLFLSLRQGRARRRCGGSVLT